MRYFIIAGEASGDLHGANLMRGLKSADSGAEFKFFGGEKMEKVGGELIKHYSEMAFMGIVKVIANLGAIRRNFKLAEQSILDFNPDVVIFIDYPGFNLKVAKFAHNRGFKTYYYISPKVWAWKEGRVKHIKRYVDKMFTIFPFETEFYRKHNYEVTYVGNPTVDEILTDPSIVLDPEGIREIHKLDNREIVTLLPGSRTQEIERLLPDMARVSRDFPDYQFVVAAAPSADIDLYRDAIKSDDVKIVYDDTYRLVKNSVASVVASGTATLEVAVLGTPQVVCYKFEFGRLANIIKNIVLKTEFFSLVNIIADREIVKELFQGECTHLTIAEELRSIIENREYRDSILEGYRDMDRALDGIGAGDRAGRAICDSL